MGWLLAAALALTLLAGWCASAEAALERVSRAGAKELGRSVGKGSTPLQYVLADVPRYLSVLMLARIAAELSATVLVAAVLLHWLGHGWRAYLITAAVMTVVFYVVAGVVPRSLGPDQRGAGGQFRRGRGGAGGPGAGAAAQAAAEPGQRAAGRGAAREARPDPRRICAGWWTCWSSAT